MLGGLQRGLAAWGFKSSSKLQQTFLQGFESTLGQAAAQAQVCSDGLITGLKEIWTNMYRSGRNLPHTWSESFCRLLATGLAGHHALKLQVLQADFFVRVWEVPRDQIGVEQALVGVLGMRTA